MLLYVNGSAAILNDREATRLATKVLFTITSPNFFEIQDTLTQNKSPITKQDLAPKKFENPNNKPKKIQDDVDGNVQSQGDGDVLPAYEPVRVTKAMAKDEILFHIVCCIHEKVSHRSEHLLTDVIPQSLQESNFRYQVR